MMKLDWPFVVGVKACMTERSGGASAAPWDSMNLGSHVGDAPQAVAENRARLAQGIGAHPVFMEQVHGVEVLSLSSDTPNGLQADACWTQQPALVCTVMVADCLPVLLCDARGQWVAAAHAGWRGLAGEGGQGVLESLWHVLEAAGAHAGQTQAWLGPCIGPQAFEVGPEVREAFVNENRRMVRFFAPSAGDRFMADLAGLARWRLQQLGIHQLHGNNSQPDWCTFTQASRFFSHRRDSRVLGSTGRMAACIWLDL